MKTLQASGKIDNGRLVLYNEDVLRQAIADIGFVTHARVEIEYGNKRTLSQNSYLYGAIVNPIKVRLKQDGWRFSPHECYKFIERKFCTFEKVNEQTGQVIDYVKPIKELTSEQFDEIIMGQVRDWAHMDLGIYCQLPHQYYQMSERAYNEWKLGTITKKEAMELTDTDPLNADA